MRIPTYHGQWIEAPQVFSGQRLLALPAVIDCHVHFRTPGQEYKEDWITGAAAALAGGVTTVGDMPNNVPSITTAKLLATKKELITGILTKHNLKIHPYFYFGATNTNFEEIKKVADEIIGIKVFLGSSTGDLLVDDPAAQEKIFALAHELDLPVAVHAEDEALILHNKKEYPHPELRDHSVIRSPEVAAHGVARAIELCERFGAKIYILHVSTPGELNLIRKAKREGLPVFAEATPHHLFLTTDDYERLGSKAQINPPLRIAADQAALWQAVIDRTIDTVASDHAPHTLTEKYIAYPESPSGMPGVETLLPLLLDTHAQGKLSLERIVELTHTNPQKIFGLPETHDWVIVDLDGTWTIDDAALKTKCGWSTFAGKKLQGKILGIVSNTLPLA